MKKSGVEEIREAWEALAADPVALATKLIELAETAESEMTRIRIARAVLDRVGLRAGLDIGVSTAVLVGPAPSLPKQPAVDIVIERLAALRVSQEQESAAALSVTDLTGHAMRRSERRHTRRSSP